MNKIACETQYGQSLVMVINGRLWLFAERVNALFQSLRLSISYPLSAGITVGLGRMADYSEQLRCALPRLWKALAIPSCDNIETLPAVDTLKDDLAMIFVSVLRGMMNRKAFPFLLTVT